MVEFDDDALGRLGEQVARSTGEVIGDSLQASVGLPEADRVRQLRRDAREAGIQMSDKQAREALSMWGSPGE